MKSDCSSKKHQEYSCLIKWGVSSKKFGVDKWCSECIERYNKSYIVQKYLESMAESEPKKKSRKKS